MEKYLPIIISAAVSFGIACIGWNRLEKRAERTALRSESFSLLSPTVTLINDIKSLAEEQMMFESDLPSPRWVGYSAPKVLRQRQAGDVKFHAKYQLLRTKLSQLESRNITIPANLLAELRIAFTSEPINDPKRLHKAFAAADKIDVELYNAFERAYPKNGNFK